ncbi:MAG: hypothetical protein ACRDY7_16775 [Acidimicrobiia bacterium]
MSSPAFALEHLEARRVLLDVLDALASHLDAIIIVGAQAVYLRTEDRLLGYQAFTTDADLVIDPARLGGMPPLADAMTLGGFLSSGEPGVWEARLTRPGMTGTIVVPVDLIVPEQAARGAGRRAARLPGEHGKTTTRKARGLEGALVDHSLLTVAALEPDDPRHHTVKVAGTAALLVAKLHKIGERLDAPGRLLAKDAGDIYRLLSQAEPAAMAANLEALLDHTLSAEPTGAALDYAAALFRTPRSPGIGLAIAALDGILPAPTITTFLTAYCQTLLQALGH